MTIKNIEIVNIARNAIERPEARNDLRNRPRG